MRTLVLLGWMMVPVVFGAYHYGPGQEKLRLDNVSHLLAKADSLAAQEHWQAASSKYEEALANLPEGRADDARRIRLQRAKVQMLGHQLPEANVALRELVNQMEDDKSADLKVRDEARETLANAQYYMTWLKRLEGLGPEEWEPDIESSRQTYRLLAEEAEAAGNPESARKHREDLEERHPTRTPRARRAPGPRPPQAVLQLQERTVQETREETGEKARPEEGRGEEGFPQRRRRPPAGQLGIVNFFE